MYSALRNSPSKASNHRHAILTFLIATLLAIIGLMRHSMDIVAPLFETHSALISIFIATTLVYAVSGAIEAKLHTGTNSFHQVIIGKINILSGSLATVLLVFVISPALGWVIFFIWNLYTAKLIYDAYQKTNQIYRTLSSISAELINVLGRGAQNEGLPV